MFGIDLGLLLFRQHLLCPTAATLSAEKKQMFVYCEAFPASSMRWNRGDLSSYDSLLSLSVQYFYAGTPLCKQMCDECIFD